MLLKKTYLKLLSIGISVGMMLSLGCAVKQLKIHPPLNPCPEYKDLIITIDNRNPDVIDVEEELDRQTCLILWLELYQAVPVWELTP
ncbi:MAG: hypothetical protein KBA02_00280 [Paludibacteraceae bacterium]|nr:hypothetical protein [Paludibacteraceae bacterium]